MPYDASKTEKKWQELWEERGLYHTDLSNTRKKYYNLVMFPYPSGDKLHIGHWYSYAPADSWGRFMRMNGANVFQPMGFDSFGLPAENYAIKTGVHPRKSIAKNTAYMRRQLRAMGAMFDWTHEVVTSTPEYYKWTQWIFLQLYKQGLAFRKKSPVNWCPKCKTVLANEQAQDGTCERCDSEVKTKDLKQWFFHLSAYAEKLLDYTGLDWPEKTKLMQQNWIGKSRGITYREKVKDMDIEFEAYDSVPQSYMAQSFAVIAPEHPKLQNLVQGTKYEKSVMNFIEEIKKKKMRNKFNIETDMEGIFTGRYIENPFGNGDLPIWVASFVVAGYGTGFVNCSAHDERDFTFAKKYNIPLHPVMFPQNPDEAKKVKNLEYCYHHDPEAILQEPKAFKGRKWGEAREDILNHLEKNKLGHRTTNYKLRDWLLSRQRYWGAPIPIVYCEKCGEMPVPESKLPILLPTRVDFKPTGTGKSPLATSPLFVKTKCPKCRGHAERETDTMDTFVCSSWYFLRYPSANVKTKPFDPKTVKKWLPVDMYIGGPEHACMHLIYARFLTYALYDAKLLPFKEPFKKLVHQGLITKDGTKMSKSKGNVVSPDEFVKKYGSDVFRMYLMFMGPFTDGGDFSDQGIKGISRFVDKMWNVLVEKKSVKSLDKSLRARLHYTIKKVAEDIKIFHFNTALAALMEFINAATQKGLDDKSKRIVTQLVAPLAPHFAEEVWHTIDQPDDSIFESTWPHHNEKYLAVEKISVPVQVNGRLRATLEVPASSSQADILKAAHAHPNVRAHIEGKKLIKEIYVPGKIVNLVVA